MPGMRVHELAKEFDMTSKELLDRLAEMKIPAKSHASILQDAYVQKVRKNLEPEIKQRAGKLEDEEAQKLADEQAKEAERKAEEKAERRAAVEKEREAREAERARREAKAHKDEEGAPAKRKISSSPFESLASQIERERERVEREAAEARERAAKKQAVEEALHNRNNRKHAKTAAPAKKHTPKAAPVSTGSNFSSLLDQINNERERLQNQKQEAAAAKKSSRDNNRKGKKNHRKGFEPSVPELEITNNEAPSEDRYAQMAVQAEKLQRDKVLAEAPLKRQAMMDKVVVRSVRKSAKPRLASVQSRKHWRRA